MRALLALPLAFSFHLRACEDQLPGGLGGAPAAPTATGPHSGALVVAGGRPVELVARNDGTLEVYGLTAGPQALEATWPVSAQVPVAGGATRIVSLRYRPEAARFEAALPGAQPGAFRVGYLADGKTQIAEGTLGQLLPPGPAVASAAPVLVDTTAAAPAATAAPDAGTTSAAAAPEEAAAEPAPPVEPTPTATETAEPTPTAEATATAEATPTAEPPPTAAPPARAASHMRAARTERRSSGSGFGSSRRHNRR